jgi:hypothetical protein
VALVAADLTGLGLSRARVAALRALAHMVADQGFDFSRPAEEVVAGYCTASRAHGMGR